MAFDGEVGRKSYCLNTTASSSVTGVGMSLSESVAKDASKNGLCARVYVRVCARVLCVLVSSRGP